MTTPPFQVWRPRWCALGHSAVVAWGLESALTVWQETDRAFDLAILDYNLGPDCGVTLGQRLQSEKPDLPVLIASGLTEYNIDLPKSMAFFSKPFSIAELQVAIRGI